MILLAALAQHLRYRRRALAAQAEARQLQQKIESALKAQVCATNFPALLHTQRASITWDAAAEAHFW